MTDETKTEAPKAQDDAPKAKPKPKPLKGQILRGGAERDAEAREQGFLGVSSKKHDRDDYSLKTGPDAPSGENGPE